MAPEQDQRSKMSNNDHDHHLDVTEVEVGANGSKNSTSLDGAGFQQLVIVGLEVESIYVFLSYFSNARLLLQSLGLGLGTVEDVLLKSGLEAFVVLVQCF